MLTPGFLLGVADGPLVGSPSDAPARRADERVELPGWVRRGRVPALDGLRAISILLVLVEHVSLTAGLPLWARDLELGHIGYVGVSMFFAISGFLITLLLVREWEATGGISLRGFYLRRAFRILPAYAAFLVVVFVLTRLQSFSLTAADWRGALTYTMNFNDAPAWEVGHLWSLSIEEQFYLVWPVLFLWMGPSRGRYALIACLALTPLVRVGLWGLSSSALETFNQVTPVRMPIAAGCLMALLATQPSPPRWLHRIQRHAQPAAAAAVLLLVVSLAIARLSWGYGATLRYSVDAAALVVLIWAMASTPASLPGRILELRPIVFVGVLSYSLYLWQELLLDPHKHFGALGWSSRTLLAILTVLASYYVIERPFLGLKGRLHAAGGGNRPARRSPAPPRDGVSRPAAGVDAPAALR